MGHPRGVVRGDTRYWWRIASRGILLFDPATLIPDMRIIRLRFDRSRERLRDVPVIRSEGIIVVLKRMDHPSFGVLVFLHGALIVTPKVPGNAALAE